MNIGRVLLVCNPSQPAAEQTARRLADFLHTRGVGSHILTDYKTIPQHPADLCVSLGGDGTTLRCARQTAAQGMNVLAVNCGSLGFLSACEADEAEECLRQILQGHYEVSRRILLSCDIVRQGKPMLQKQLAFNDCVIKTNQPRAFTLQARCNGRELKRFYGDGVIVSTPAGSTAYALAAGGPIVEPDLQVLLLTPICPHSLTQRPLLLQADARLEFTPLFKNDAETAVVSLDGQESFELHAGDSVAVRRSPYWAQLICGGRFDFFGRLRRKLEWGER
ncbi:NAD(+)/NADH kinase [Candidatus Avelusimicrobium facis]|uniref:NAD(+)/NADH kinase n=1 Tax=Candidatus Avelusimicrobium facis TaxID=3416203 RepID=UPI003D14DA8D